MTAPETPVRVLAAGDISIDLRLPDGGLKRLAGVHNFQVFRASRWMPETADGDGWTYAHHMDLAVWKGRLCAAWAMTPQDEDVPPCKLVYATSSDGIHWSAPADLFPREHAWPCRFYFYRATNGRMLAFSAAPAHNRSVNETEKKSLLVREISPDYRLGEVFTLLNLLPDRPALFTASRDPGFVEACREAADHRLLLEQQDYGRFLGDRRMPWHDNPTKLHGWAFGKAFCFYHRADGVLVGLSKMGFVTLSRDGGKTWSEPVLPPTLTAGSGKIWGQRTADGRFALVYNPDPARVCRHPLVLVHGDDGHEFRDLRVVHGEMPVQRYPGSHKDMGPQYMRGLAEWSDDGTFADKQAMWLIYSVHKEDIWVSRIPLPVQPDNPSYPEEDIAKASTGSILLGWNLYSPCWAPVNLVDEAGERCLQLADGDPHDYARAIRGFPATAHLRAGIRLKAAQMDARLEIELCDAHGHRPVRIMLTETGRIQAANGNALVDLGPYLAGDWITLSLTVDVPEQRYTAQVNQAPIVCLTLADDSCRAVEYLSLRTGSWRGCAELAVTPVEHDRPLPVPAVFHIATASILPA